MLEIIIIILSLCWLVDIWCPDGCRYDWVENILLTTLCAFVSAIVLGIVLAISAQFMIETNREDCRCNIYSLRNDSSIQGQFFLGSGYINQEQNYYYFWKNNRGGICQGNIETKNVELFQDENVTPYMSWQNIHYRMNKWLWTYPKFVDTKDTKHDFHIPSNSIIMEFKVK